MTFMTFHILGMSSSQLTNSYFSEGLKPPTRHSFQTSVVMTVILVVKYDNVGPQSEDVAYKLKL